MPEPPLATTPERQIRRDLLLVVLAVVSVIIAVNDLLVPRPHPRFTFLDAVDLAIVGVFIADFVAEARRSGGLLRHMRERWWELPALIPINSGLVGGLDGVGMIRGFVLLRLARIARLLRLVGATARLRHASRYARRVADRANLYGILAGGAAAVLFGGTVYWLLEREAVGASYSASVWLAFNLLTNIGFVGLEPATPAGFALAALLQLLGIGFVGLLAGSLAAALLREPPNPD